MSIPNRPQNEPQPDQNEPVQELDREERMMRETLLGQSGQEAPLSPELMERMQGDLAAFRRKLAAHPYVKKLEWEREGGRPRRPRLVLRYGLVAALMLFICISFSSVGRRMGIGGVDYLFGGMNKAIQRRSMAVLGAWEAYKRGQASLRLIPDLKTAQLHQLIGLTADGAELIALISSSKDPGNLEKKNSRSLWAINIATGRHRVIQEGKVAAVLYPAQNDYGKRQKLLFYTTRENRLGHVFKALWTDKPEESQLWMWAGTGNPVLVETSDVYFGTPAFSPDQRRVIFNMVTPLGAQTVVYDVEKRTKVVWPAVKTEAVKKAEPKERRLALGWAEDGQSVIAVRQAPDPDEHMRLGRLERVSADGEKVLEYSDAVKSRIPFDVWSLYGGKFSGDNRFFSIDSLNQVDVFSSSPLRHLVTLPGANQARWVPDGKRLLYSDLAQRGKNDRPGYRIFQPATAKVEPIELNDPPTLNGRLWPFSPDSKYTLIPSYYGVQFRILNLETRKASPVFEGISPDNIAWSPDSRSLVVYGKHLVGRSYESGNMILDVAGGAAREIGLGGRYMTAILWPDKETIVSINRFYNYAPNRSSFEEPFRIATTNVGTGKSRVVEVRE